MYVAFNIVGNWSFSTFISGNQQSSGHFQVTLMWHFSILTSEKGRAESAGYYSFKNGHSFVDFIISIICFGVISYRNIALDSCFPRMQCVLLYYQLI